MVPSEKKRERNLKTSLASFNSINQFWSVILFVLLSIICICFSYYIPPHTLSVLGQVFISLYQGNHNNSQDALPTLPSPSPPVPSTQWPPSWTSASECLISRLYSINFKLNSQSIFFYQKLSPLFSPVEWCPNQPGFSSWGPGQWCVGASQVCTSLPLWIMQ